MDRWTWTMAAIAAALLLGACTGSGDDDDDTAPDVHCSDPINEVVYPSDGQVLDELAYTFEGDSRTTVEGIETFEYDVFRTEDEHKLQVVNLVVDDAEAALMMTTERDGEFVLGSTRYDPPIPLMRVPPVDGNGWTAQGTVIPEVGEETPYDVEVTVTGPECIETYQSAYLAWKHTVTMPGDSGPTHSWYTQGIGVVRQVREGLEEDGQPAYSDALMDRETVKTTPVNDYLGTVAGEAVEYQLVVLPAE